jgi:predicted PurR-regulated permease PerM
VTSAPESPRRLIVWAVVTVAAASVLAWGLYLVRDVLLLVYVSGLFAIGFSPVVRLIERQRLLPIGPRRVPRWLAILVVYLVILGALTGVGFLVLPPLVGQARELANELPRLTAQAQQYLVDRGLLQEPITLKEAIQQAPGKPTDAVGTIMTALWGFFGGVVGVATILILTFYLLIEADGLVAGFVRLFPRDRRARVAGVAHDIARKVAAWLAGQFLLAAVIGVTSAIGLGLMRVPYFYVLALLAAVGEFLPIIGPVLAAIPAIAVAWSVSWKLALAVGLYYLVQQQLEANFLVPKIMERQLGVSPVTVLIAVLVGTSLLGVIGALLAVPSAAIVQVLVQELLTEEPGDVA